MLEGFVQVYKEMKPMTDGIKKQTYEKNMDQFRGNFGHYFEEMTAYVEGSQDSQAAALEISDSIISQIKENYTRFRRIPSGVQFTLNMFTIYYIFPAILLTESPNAEQLCQVLSSRWGEAFKDSKIKYTDYKTIHDSFKETIFGFALHRD